MAFKTYEQVLAYKRSWYQKNKKKRHAYLVQYYQSHKEQRNAADRILRRRVRTEILDHYGNRCICCGEDREVFLAIDHVNGGGYADKGKHRRSGTGLYVWIKKNGYPDSFQILCHNCNWAKEVGICPHQAGKVK